MAIYANRADRSCSSVLLESEITVSKSVLLSNKFLDFIDMKSRRDRKAVLDLMKREMDKDKAKTHILPITPLGIMQMTRQRHQESTSSGIYTGCPYCNERGIVKSPRAVSTEIQRRLVSILRRLERKEREDASKELGIEVLLHPSNMDRLKHEDEKLLLDIEKAYHVKLSFRADPAYHVENFKILESKTGRELI